jgi:hypothetical protein
MNKRQIIASLNNIANTLDNLSLYKEANSLTNIMTKIATDGWDDLENTIDVNVPAEIPTKDNQKLDNLKQEYITGVDNIISEFKYPNKDIKVVKIHLKRYLRAPDEQKLKKYQENKRYHNNRREPNFFGLLLELFDFTEYFINKYDIRYLDMSKIIGTITI